MKTLLRSLFLADSGDDPQQFLDNHRLFLSSGLGFEVPEYNLLWGFIREFVLAHNHTPAVATLRAHFTHTAEDSILNEIEHLIGLRPLTKGDFETVLNARADDRRMRLWTETLKEAAVITQTGLEVKEGREKRILKGPIDAARYVVDKSRDVVAPTLGGKLSGEVTKDGAAAQKEYETVEADPLAGMGQMTWIKQIDVSLAGAKRYELWIHAAFTGGLKSSLMLNWAYNQAVIFKHNVLIFSLEMPYSQCRRVLYAMHSLHPKFRETRVRLGLQQDVTQDVGVPYQHIRDGTLHTWHPNARQFYLDFVIPDFNGDDVVGHPFWKPDYGKVHIEVADPDKPDFTIQDLRSLAEVIYAKSPFGMIFIDHCGLMSPRRSRQSTTDNLNEVIRDLKKLALGFHRGQGIAVVGLFQISREGYKNALKAKEKTGKVALNLTYLSYSNECCDSATLLMFSRGLLPIREAVTGDKVWSRTGWKKVTAVFDQGVRPTWLLTTDRGAVLEGTGTHQVRVLGDGSLDWCCLEHITAGMRVVGAPTYAFPTESPDIRSGSFFTRGLTVDMAWLLGAWDGDGVYHPTGVAFTGNRQEVALCAEIARVLQSMSGKVPTIRQYPSRQGSFDITLRDVDLKAAWEGLAGPRGKKVPLCIFQAPREYVCAYLKGLFDTDGWVNNQYVVGLRMKSETFLREVQALLGALGIDACLEPTTTILKKTGKAYPGWNLRLRGRAALQTFSAEIGFTEPRKMARVHTVLAIKRITDKRAYPVPATFLAAYAQTHLPGTPRDPLMPKAFYINPYKVRRTGLVPHGAIAVLIGLATRAGIDTTEVQFLRHLLALQVTTVRSCVPTGREMSVYDLEVGGDHEYQTGPVLSHNCERSADIVTMGWIDDDLVRESRLELHCLKARDDKKFEPFVARVEWPCRRILTCYEVPRTAAENAKMGAAVDKATKELEEGK